MMLLAEFRDADTLLDAARGANGGELTILDAFTPMPVPAIDELLPENTSHLRVAMLVCGLAVAAAAFALQWWSAVYDYPINSGGRPLFSWPVFLLFPAEVGMLAAALAGIVAFLYSCGLPRLNHPLFDIPEFERASQDHFFLLVERRERTRLAEESEALVRARQALRHAGALTVYEVRA